MDPSSHKRHSSMSTPRKSTFSSNKTDRFAGEALISPQLPSTSHTSPSNGRPTRKSVMTSVRRSLSVPRKSRSTSKKSLAEQTAEDQTYTSSRFRRHDPSLSPPTVEQIAMGLHLSRTPHLRGHAPNQFHNHPGGFPRSISLPLPPPPARSAMKKTHAPSGAAGMNPGLAAPSASSTTITSLSTPHSSNTANSVSLTSLKSRMTRLLISSKGNSVTAASTTVSPRTSMSDPDVSQKKAVRFFVDPQQMSNALDDV
ncbi:hypothetical protein PM082_011308 [Marasmius tenuissimus]|nr:hypothetical protein PM082_011308 [Marasmius tenuissimus]